MQLNTYKAEHLNDKQEWKLLGEVKALEEHIAYRKANTEWPGKRIRLTKVRNGKG